MDSGFIDFRALILSRVRLDQFGRVGLAIAVLYNGIELAKLHGARKVVALNFPD